MTSATKGTGKRTGPPIAEMTGFVDACCYKIGGVLQETLLRVLNAEHESSVWVSVKLWPSSTDVYDVYTTHPEAFGFEKETTE